MNGMIKKAFIADPKSADDRERSIVAVVSDQSIRDADGEIIIIGKSESDGIDLTRYRKNPVLIYQHRTDVLGTALWIKKQSPHLIAKFKFSDKTQLARETYELYKEKTMRAFSVGFIPGNYDRHRKIHKTSTLLEISAVHIGSNEESLSLSFKKGLITDPMLLKDFHLDSFEDPAFKILSKDRIQELATKAIAEALGSLRSRVQGKDRNVYIEREDREVQVDLVMLNKTADDQLAAALKKPDIRNMVKLRIDDQIKIAIDKKRGKVY